MKLNFNMFIVVFAYVYGGASWSWSYGTWIYTYLCNQCLSPLTLLVRIPHRRVVLDTTFCNKVCQWLAVGRWFSLGTLVSSTNKIDRNDIIETLLKVALNTINHLNNRSLIPKWIVIEFQHASRFVYLYSWKQLKIFIWHWFKGSYVRLWENFSFYISLYVQHVHLFISNFHTFNGGCRGRDRMVVRFNNYLCHQCLSPLMLWVRISIRPRCTRLCDNVCQWLATGRRFSPIPSVSSTNKTDRHDITDILLKVALNTNK